MIRTARHMIPLYIILLLFLLTATPGYSQPGNPVFGLTGDMLIELDMQSLAIMDIESSDVSTNLTLEAPSVGEAGTGLSTNPIVSNTSNWLNYSSANRDVVSRSIQVNISSGSVPGGMELRLHVASSTGADGGTLGIPVGSAVTLSTSPQTVISGIQGAFTGDGPNNGHQLTYSLYIASGSYGLVETGSTILTITYTMIDN